MQAGEIVNTRAPLRCPRLKIVLLAVGLVSACSGAGIADDPTSTAAGSPPTTESPSVPTSAAVTTAPSDTAAPTTVPESEPLPTNAADYAAAAFEAWMGSNQDLLARLMTEESLATLRSITFETGAAWEFERCEGAAGSSYCTWSGPDGTLSFRVANQAAAAGEERAITEVIVAGG